MLKSVQRAACAALIAGCPILPFSSASGQAVPVWARNYTAVEVRTLVAENTRLKSKYQLSNQALDEIIGIVGRRRRTANLNDVVKSVEILAAEAAGLKVQLANLSADNSALVHDGKKVARATAIETARQSLDAGRFGDVSVALSTVKATTSGSPQDTALWLKTVDAQASAAKLQFNYDLAVDIWLEAAKTGRGTDDDRFQLTIAAAETQLESAAMRSDSTGYRRAIQIANDDVYPLTVALTPKHMLIKMRAYEILINAYRGLGSLTHDPALIAKSLEYQRLSSEVNKTARQPGVSAEDQAYSEALNELNRAHGMMAHATETDDRREMIDAIGVHDRILPILETNEYMGKRAAASKGRAQLALWQLSARTSGNPGSRTLLDEAEANLRKYTNWMLMLNEDDYGIRLDLGATLFYRGYNYQDASDLTEALKVYRQLLTDKIKVSAPAIWAIAAEGAASSLQIRAGWTKGCQDVKDSLVLFADARQIVAVSSSASRVDLLDKKAALSTAMRSDFCR